MPSNKYIRRRRNALKVILAMIVIIILALIIGFIITLNQSDNNIPQNSNDSSLITSETTSETVQSEISEVTTTEPVAELTQEEKKQYVLDHPQEYTPELIEFMNKYDQVIDYVYNYPNRDSLSVSANVSEDKTDTDFPLLIQWDARWGYDNYGDSLVGVSGCGPTSLAIVYRGLTRKTDQSPATICKMSEDNGYYVSGVGTSWDLMTSGASDLGLTSKQIGLDEGTMSTELENGHPIICSVRAGDFTKGGHFIVITGYKDEKFIINDPNSKENSSKLWDYSVIEPQIKNLWSFSL